MCIEREQTSTALRPMPHFNTYGGSHFSAGPSVYHPEFQPELNDFEIPHGPHFHGHDPVTGSGPNGFSEVEIHFATPLQENCANGTFLHEGQQGFSEVEVHFEYNVGSTSGPGGTTYMTGYTNGTSYEGMDSTTEVIDVMNNFTHFAMPVGDFI